MPFGYGEEYYYYPYYDNYYWDDYYYWEEPEPFWARLMPHNMIDFAFAFVNALVSTDLFFVALDSRFDLSPYIPERLSDFLDF